MIYMEEFLKVIGEKAVKVATEEVVKRASPIILRRILRRPREIFLKFALIFDFYELPALDEALQLVESCLIRYKGDNASILHFKNVNFAYVISYEIEDDYLPDLDLVGVELEEMLPAKYISQMEIILSPRMGNRRVENKREIERLILSGTELLDKIITALKKDDYIADALKIRSYVKLMVIESDSLLISDFYRKILDKLSKEKVALKPYMHIIKGENGRDKMVISMRDSTVVKEVIDILT